jgi:hypothetical protein
MTEREAWGMDGDLPALLFLPSHPTRGKNSENLVLRRCSALPSFSWGLSSLKELIMVLKMILKSFIFKTL